MLRLEVNLDILRANLRALRSLTASKICAVVKADAYGHGLGAIQAMDIADEFAVSSIDEAEELGELTDKPINILSLPDKTVKKGYRSTIFPSVATESDVEFVAAMRGASAVNLKVNTGMNRYGMAVRELENMMRKAEKCGLSVKSVFSHIYDLSAADMQFEAFEKCVGPLSEYIGQKHILSGNFTVLPEYMHLDMVRPGLVLYGYGHELVHPAATAKCSITQVRSIADSDNIGYGKCLSGKKRNIAVLSAGYADGIRRISDNVPRYAEISGYLCPIVGQVCMDAVMADTTGIDVQVGDEACLLGGAVTAEAYAVSCGTINYEILTGFGKRTKRVYKQSEL